MKPTTSVAHRNRPNRLLVALAAGWMIASLAIGGAVTAQAEPSSDGSVISEAVQP